MAASFVLSCVLASVPALAAAEGGGVLLYVPERPGITTHCIDSQDTVWVTLRRLVTEKAKRGWFTVENGTALYISPTVRTNAKSGKPLKFPLLTNASFAGYSPGQVSVPIDYTIVDSLPLKDGNVTYTGIEIEVTLLNTKGKTAWGTGLKTLADVTKQLPIPKSPYSEAAGYLLDFTNKVIDQEVAAQDPKDVAKSAAFTLNFSPITHKGEARCQGDFASTGTLAVLQEGGNSHDPNYVPLANVNAYCWAADLTPAFALKALKPAPGVLCDKVPNGPEYHQVANDYVAFFVNAVPTSETLGGGESPEKANAELRCSAHGIPLNSCLRRPHSHDQ